MSNNQRGLAVFLACMVMALCWLSRASAQTENQESFQLGGLLFGDVYHIAGHHTAQGDGATGAVLRRGYLTANFKLGEAWYGRARIELNQDGEFETYDFEVDIKDLYLARKFGRQEFVAGLSPPPTFDLIESMWAARYLMRTPMDLQGVPSRDTGIALNGPISADGRWGYRAMLGAGIEFGNESSDGARWMGALTWRSAADLIVDLYLDYDRNSGTTDHSTVQLFVGKQSESLRWGVQYSHQDRQDDPRLELASGFLVGGIRDKLSVIGRVDRILEPSPKGDNISYIPFDPSARATMLLGGLEYRYSPTFRVTPNVIWTRYDRNDLGVRPEDDLHLRLTFFLDLE